MDMKINFSSHLAIRICIGRYKRWARMIKVGEILSWQIFRWFISLPMIHTSGQVHFDRFR